MRGVRNFFSDTFLNHVLTATTLSGSPHVRGGGPQAAKKKGEPHGDIHILLK
jgi:hypothetical protein